MFKVNDYVVYGTTGVCRITDIAKDESIGDHQTEYYVLHPVYCDNMTIKIPVKNEKVSMRAILSANEVTALIAAMPQLETVWIEDNRERNESFKTMLRRGSCQDWIKLIKTLYTEKKSRASAGKSLTNSDEEIMRTAEKQLYEEFSVVLNIPPDEVVSYIHAHIP
ncbi:MAG TPA: CarD family transcriptional regulator [Syntrophomonas sp.]|jgi:CarD family transcriptional regulator|nr:CarD family transcriptional regulator [Syntrophomonas sp.]